MSRWRLWFTLLVVVARQFGEIAWAVAPSAKDVAEVARSVDDVIARAGAAESVPVLPVCTDAEFLRRSWLDLAGRTPPLADAARLAEGQTPFDRRALVEALLSSPEFASHWARQWTEYLTDRRPFNQNDYDGRRLQQFLQEAFSRNQPYDQLVTALLAGQGSSDVDGEVNFLLRYGVEPGPLAGAVSQKFLGLSLQCAECHDHPHAAWKQRDFWGLAAYFARLRRMTPANAQEGETFSVVIERPRGELQVVDSKAPADEDGRRPRRTVFPQLPGGRRIDPRQTAPRAALAAWMAAPDNPYFARHCVNQVWRRLLGAPLIEGFDHWPDDASPNAAAVLDLLSRDFIEHQFDVRHLFRTIVLTEAYQRSCRATAETTPAQAAREQAVWARGRIRPLSADQIHLSLAQAFGYRYDDKDFHLAKLTGEEFTYDLPIQSFGETPLTLRRSMALYESDHIRGAVEFSAQALIRIHGEAIAPSHIERMYLAFLSRRPTEAELDQMLLLASQSPPQVGLEDAVWVILNSAEFVTNH